MEVIHNEMVQDCLCGFSRINIKSDNNIGSPRRKTGPFRPTWASKIYIEFIYVLYLLNHLLQSTPDAIVLKYNYKKRIESMGTVTTD